MKKKMTIFKWKMIKVKIVCIPVIIKLGERVKKQKWMQSKN
jgi:hypothetical protein